MGGYSGTVVGDMWGLEGRWVREEGGEWNGIERKG